MPKSTLAARFWPKVDRRGADECWRWTAGLVRGYGSIRVEMPGRWGRKYAHRVAWELSYGPLPDGAVVCHRCDEPLCVNPAHLFIGSQLDNIADMVTKGRQRRGVKVPHAKLTPDTVRAIRDARGTASSLVVGRTFGVHPRTVRDVWNGLTWGWLP